MPANLLLHCGASAVGRDALACVPTPDATETWQPIPHVELLETVEGVLGSAGLRVAQEAHGVTHDGARYFGLLEVANGHDDTEYARVLGVRNSHDKRFPAGRTIASAPTRRSGLRMPELMILRSEHWTPESSVLPEYQT